MNISTELQIECVSQAIEAYFNNFRSNDENSAEVYTKIAAGSYVTHENKAFIFFEIDGLSILIFKSA
jgi:hypothetical protein